MFEKFYVIQHRFSEGEQWTTFSTRYPTVQAATEEAQRRKYIIGKYYRIAEAYIQIRYKAVKTQQEGG